MNQVTAPYGGSINYSYTPVRFYLSGVVGMEKSNAITQKTTSDGGVWTYSYTPSASSPNFDMTVENGPTGTITYKHYGYGTVTSGTVWQVGLLASKQWGSNNVETYTWTGQQVSPTKLLRPGSSWAKFDNVVNAPLLASKVVTLDGQTYSTTYSGFDSYGNPASMAETGPNGGSRTTTLTYNINTSKWIINQLKNENFTGGSTIRTFDSNGNLTSINKDGVTTNYTYHSDGNIASITYPRGLVHNFSNYKRGIPRTENQPEGIVISRVVSDAGNVTSETNGNGKTTTYGYDLLNRPTSIGYPTGNSVSIAYTTTKKTATRGSLSEVTNYDGFYRPTSISLGGITRTSSYDAAGRKSFESNPGSAAGTTFLYDVLNRVTKQTYADGMYKTFAYGAGSRTVTDENGKATTYKYRSYGDPSAQFLMSVTAPVTAANVTISRNARDLVTAVSQGGLTRTYGYNSNYYLTSVGNPETGTTTFGRDAAGNMTSRAVGASGSTSYTYDNQNRLTGVTYPGATPAVSMTYSKTHKLLSVTSSVASKAYTYDSNDNLINETQTIDGNVFSTSYGYNTKDQLSSITYPKSARVVSFSPDVLGRPTQASGYATAVSYWPSGQVKQINYSNGTVTNYGQNARLWPSSFSTQQGANTYINSSHT